jgi:hypothetical protein
MFCFLSWPDPSITFPSVPLAATMAAFGLPPLGRDAVGTPEGAGSAALLFLLLWGW